MAKDINELKMELVRAIVHTEDQAILQAALKVLQLGNSTTLPQQEISVPPTASNRASSILPGGSPPTGEAKGLQDDIDEVFNPK